MIQNFSIICVDDEKPVLESYKRILAPTIDPLAEVLSLIDPQDESAPNADGPPAYDLHLAESGEAAIEIAKNLAAKNKHIAAGFFDMRMPGGY